jgi:cell division protein FtsL
MSSRPARVVENLEEARPELSVVRRRRRGLIQRSAPRRFAPVAIGAAICIMTVILGVLLEQVILAQSAFKLQRLRTDVNEAEAQYQELLLEATKLESPQRIETYARYNLGMQDPTRLEYIVADINAGRSARVAVAPDSNETVLGLEPGNDP